MTLNVKDLKELVMGKLNKTDREWQRELSPEEFRITRQKGTEPAFTGKYWNSKQDGVYVCRCCGEALFSSDTKYDSGSGWPSFYRPIAPGLWKNITISRMAWCVPKLSVIIVMHIWAMFLMMDRNRPACAIASTRRH